MTHKTLSNNDDTYVGSSNQDVINGAGGDDSIFGSAGDDVIHGGKGDDILAAGTGSDHLYGDAGNDDLKIYEGHQFADGGAGFDFLDFKFATRGVHVSLDKDAAKYQIDSVNYKVDYSSIEGVYGSSLNDAETGNGKNNELRGEDGSDKLAGGGGDDFLFGGNGKDVMTGGAGKDTFMFGSSPDGRSEFDKITDFSAANDRLGLNAGTFDVHGHGKTTAFGDVTVEKLDANEFQSGVGHVAANADVRVIYDSSSGILYYDANGSGDGDLGQLADLGKNLHITASSLVIYGF